MVCCRRDAPRANLERDRAAREILHRVSRRYDSQLAAPVSLALQAVGRRLTIQGLSVEA